MLTNSHLYCILYVYQINRQGERPMSYMDYIKALIDFIMNLISLFKKNNNIEPEKE